MTSTVSALRGWAALGAQSVSKRGIERKQAAASTMELRAAHGLEQQQARAECQRTSLVPAEVKRLEVHRAHSQLALALQVGEDIKKRRQGSRGMRR